MAQFRFADLPEDLQPLIVDRVTLPTDLATLCRVSKKLHALAVKPLYNVLDLDIGGALDVQITALVNPNNIGLAHVRYLRLGTGALSKRNGAQLQKIHLVTRILLEFLPRDILQGFIWLSPQLFSGDNYLLLYQKQRMMTILQIVQLDRNILPDLKKMGCKPNIDPFACARTLGVCTKTLAEMALASHLLQATWHSLEKLMVGNDLNESRASSVSASEDLTASDLHDLATGPGLLTRTLFACKLPFETCTALPNLLSLTLRNVNLRLCVDTWCKVIDFTKIQILHLSDCGGVETLLAQLSKTSCLPRSLRTLTLQHKDNDENEALLALDVFLCQISGLKELNIDIEESRSLPAVMGLKNHCKTLKLINVHAYRRIGIIQEAMTTEAMMHEASRINRLPDCNEIYWTPDQFGQLTAACKVLEQLSCAWPATDLYQSPPSVAWTNYERTLRQMKSLATLHISTWPYTRLRSSNGMNHGNQGLLDICIQALAQRLFETASGKPVRLGSSTPRRNYDLTQMPPPPQPPLPPPSPPDIETLPLPNRNSRPKKGPLSTKLHLIAFGTADNIHERRKPTHQLLYLRSTRKSSLGKEEIYAAPVSWAARRFLEPRSSVLDFDLLQKSAPPLRGEDSRFMDHPPPPPPPPGLHMGTFDEGFPPVFDDGSDSDA